MNKDHAPLPQINLALLFGEESTLPFYYRKLAGNISDVKIVQNLLAELDYLGLNRLSLSWTGQCTACWRSDEEAG